MKNIKHILIGLLVVAFATPLYAKPPRINLNKISYQISVEQWATTNTAKVIVSIHAAVNNQQLDKLHQQILENLKKIAANATWHITQFNRNQGQSGLEQVTVLAQARLPQDGLVGLRDKAKKISTQGQTYKIAAIQFTPNMAEIEKVRGQLRDQIYQKVTKEIAELDKQYPKQKFFVHSINFASSGTVTPRPTAAVFAKQVRFAGAGHLAVSNKVIVNANVVVASRIRNGKSKS